MFTSLAVATLAATGLVNLLIILLIGALVAGLVYWVLGMFLPHPIPPIAAAIIVVIALIYALQGL